MRSKWECILLTAALATAVGCRNISDLTGLLTGLDRPTVKAIRPTVTDISPDSIGLAFEVDVGNPYPFPLKSGQFRYGLDIEGREFVKSGQSTALDVPANGTGTVTLPVTLTYAKLFETYRSLSDANEVSYALHGTLDVLAGGRTYEAPLSHKGKLPVLRAPKFSNFKVDFANVSPRGAGVTVQADIVNPNIFAIGLHDLGYALKLGEVSVGSLVAKTDRSIGPGAKGKLRLSGKVSALSALADLLKGRGLGAPTLATTGTIKTPYGQVRTPK